MWGSGGLGGDEVPRVEVDVGEVGVLVAVVVGMVRRHLLRTGGDAPNRLDVWLRGPPAHCPFPHALPAPCGPRAPPCLSPGAYVALPPLALGSPPGPFASTPAPLPSGLCRGSRPLSPASLPAPQTPVAFSRLPPCPWPCPRPLTAPRPAPCAPLPPAWAPCSPPCARPGALPLAPVSFPCPCPFPALSPVPRCLGVGRPGLGAHRRPTAHPLGRAAGAHYPLAVGPRFVGLGTRHQPNIPLGAKKLLPRGDLKDIMTAAAIRMGDDHVVHSCRDCEDDMLMGSRSIANQFYVMETEAFNFVLGTEFLAEHRQILSLTLQAPYVLHVDHGDGQESVPLEQSEHTSSYLRVCKKEPSAMMVASKLQDYQLLGGVLDKGLKLSG